MNIVKNNTLIAEFITEEPEVLKKDLGNGAAHSMHYHDEWDWIMPVIEKIDQIGASVIIGRMFCEIKYIDPLHEEKTFDVRIASGVKINAINGAVIDFITWYNKTYSN